MQDECRHEEIIDIPAEALRTLAPQPKPTTFKPSTFAMVQRPVRGMADGSGVGQSPGSRRKTRSVLHDLAHDVAHIGPELGVGNGMGKRCLYKAKL